LLDPPAPASVEQALLELAEMGALEPAELGDYTLTPMGHHLAQLPLDVRLGKVLIIGCVLRCLDPILTIVAVLSDRTPFKPLPFDEAAKDAVVAARKKLLWVNSDHLAMARAFDMWRQEGTFAARRAFAERHGMSHETLRAIAELRTDFASVLADLGFIQNRRHDLHASGSEYDEGESRKVNFNETAARYNACKDEANVIRAALVAGLYPNVVKIVCPERRYSETLSGAVPLDFKPQDIRLYTLVGSANTTRVTKPTPVVAEDADAAFDSSDEEGDDEGSLVTAETAVTPAHGIVWRGLTLQRVFLHPSSVNAGTGEFRCPWLVFYEKAGVDKVYIRDSSMVTPFAMILFGGPIQVHHHDNKITLGKQKWVSFHSEPRISALVNGLRVALHTLLEVKITAPHLDISSTGIVEAILRLLITNGL
jgi:hypothetical protein